MDPPRPHAPSRMALYLAKAKGGVPDSLSARLDVETRAKVCSHCQCTSPRSAQDSRPVSLLQGPAGRRNWACDMGIIATDVEATPARIDAG